MELICPICNSSYIKSTGDYNRAIKLGARMYCGKSCSHIGRKLQSDKHLKTAEQLKAEKAAYDKVYREKNIERLKKGRKEYFAKDYAANPDKYKEIRKKRMPKHVEYCRLPKARAKEREARYRRLGQDKTKVCLCCNKEKRLIDFSCYDIFPDKRIYLCKECEATESKELNITMREVIQTIRTALNKHKSKLNIRDITPYPYLIEAHKYSLLLKRLTK